LRILGALSGEKLLTAKIAKFAERILRTNNLPGPGSLLQEAGLKGVIARSRVPHFSLLLPEVGTVYVIELI
jgi:hypothetical protein